MAVRLSTGLVQALAGGGPTPGPLKTLFTNAVLGLYTGGQPVNADLIETGELIGYITLASGVFVPGQPDNGLNWNTPIDGVCAKPPESEFSFIPALTKVGGWARLYDNARVLGASTTEIRMDLLCGVGSGELQWESLNFTAGTKYYLSTFNLSILK